jgi:hypothetical protein
MSGQPGVQVRRILPALAILLGLALLAVPAGAHGWLTADAAVTSSSHVLAADHPIQLAVVRHGHQSLATAQRGSSNDLLDDAGHLATVPTGQQLPALHVRADLDTDKPAAPRERAPPR